SSAAISGRLLSFDLKRIADVREIVLNSPILDTAEMSSSLRPSAKYSSLGSGLMFVNGRTAIRFLLGAPSDAGEARGRASPAIEGRPVRTLYTLICPAIFL